MPHWKSLTDRSFIYAFDLGGRDVTVKISKVVAGELTAVGGRKSKKPLVYFEGKEKPLALNATNAKTIAGLYSNYTEKWVGKLITMYPTTAEMAGEVVEAIRIRPIVPKPTATAKPDIEDEPETETIQ